VLAWHRFMPWSGQEGCEWGRFTDLHEVEIDLIWRGHSCSCWWRAARAITVFNWCWECDCGLYRQWLLREKPCMLEKPEVWKLLFKAGIKLRFHSRCNHNIFTEFCNVLTFILCQWFSTECVQSCSVCSYCTAMYMFRAICKLCCAIWKSCMHNL